MVAFMDETDRRQFSRADRLNGAASAPERLQRETDDSIYDVTVSRGPVVEKLGRMIAEGKQTQPGRREGELVWSRFYSLDGHARSPLVGMLHATLVLQFYADGSASAVGWLGVMNGTRVDADMQRLTRIVDGHFAAYGRDPTVYRKLMVKGTDETIADFRRRPDPAGVSFYGPPVFPGDVERSYEFVEGLFTKFTDAWLDPGRAAPQRRGHAGGRPCPGSHAQALAGGPAVQRPVCERAGALRGLVTGQRAAGDPVLTGGAAVSGPAPVHGRRGPQSAAPGGGAAVRQSPG
jgi:hypothetical protein